MNPDFEIVEHNGKKTLVRYHGQSGECVIPSGVEVIGEMAFRYCQHLNSVVIPEGVTIIEVGAFASCSNLRAIYFPSTLIFIRDGYNSPGAFEKCTSLTSITIPVSVTMIGSRTFFGCTSLTSVVIPPSVEKIGDFAFYYCTNLTTINLPIGIKVFGYRIFFGCKNLTNVKLHTGDQPTSEFFLNHTREINATYYPAHDEVVLSLHPEEGRGQKAKTRTSITLPSLDTSKGPIARLFFPRVHNISHNLKQNYHVHNLGYYDLMASLLNGTIKHLSEYDALFPSFQGDSYETAQAALLRLQYPYELEESYRAVYLSYLKRYAHNFVRFFIQQGNIAVVSSLVELSLIPVKSIQSFVDIASKNEFPEMVAILLDYQDKNRGISRRSSLNLKKVKIACTWLTFKNDDETLSIAKYRGKDIDIVIPALIDGKPVKKIGWQKFRSIFYANKDVQHVHIEHGIEEIGDRAFFGCYHLQTIEIPDSVTRIGQGAFISTALTAMDIPDSVTTIAGDALFKSSWYYSIKRNLRIFGDICLRSVRDMQKYITIPEGVRIISERAFYERCVKTIILPESLQRINTYAFSYCCDLEEIKLPHHMLSIDPYAFERCYSLTSVVLPEGLKEVSEGVFSMCDHLSSVVIPEGVLRVGAKAFEGCTRLKDISIPKSVTTIDKTAFERTPFADAMPDEIKALMQ